MANLDDLLELLEVSFEHRRYNKIETYAPYPKQMEFHEYGLTKIERLLRAGNQEGKTYAGAAETTYHLTGLYPSWWSGRKFDHPVRAWCAGVTGVLVREGPQLLLCGKPGVEEEFGTGFIPKHLFVDKPSLARGVTDAYDTIQVRHVSGGISTLGFKSYEQGREKFQSATLDFIWCDEEPPADIYSEILARFTATAGFVFITFTPLKGMSTVVARFLSEPDIHRSDTVMTLYDAKHIKPEDYETILAKYPPHERDARIMGVPMQGSGRVFPISDEAITEPDLIYIPKHWTKLWGIDFGIGHPFAAVLIAWDKDADVLHVTHAIRMKDGLPLQHSAAMRPIAANIKVAWPQDGTERRDDGKPLADHYRRVGLTMLHSHATFPDGSLSTEAGILEIHGRMSTSRFKVAQTLMQGQWGEEFRNYHREDGGKLVKKMDDLMSATRVAVMQKRSGEPLDLIADYAINSKKKGRPDISAIADNVDFNIWM